MRPNREYARLRDGGFLRDARLSREANLTIRILSKKCKFGGKRGDVSIRLRDGMKVEDWLAECRPVVNTCNSGMTHLLALYLEDKLIELV
jgi:hypothetical protein